jgi:two-component system phosphate regulon response regulator PhoB
MDELAEILIVEDDATIRTILEMALLGAGFRRVRTAARGDEGLAEAKRLKPDLVLLDVMLPGLDGFSVCSRLRELPALAATRIILLTARTQTDDIVRGLSCGADDYVTKPFDRAVLLARIRAVLRRGPLTAPSAGFDGLVIDEENRAATLNGAALRLAPGELRILALLVSNRGRVLTRARILDAVQADVGKEVSERTIDVQVANLRRKLGAWADHVETIRGVGYRVAAPAGTAPSG